MFVELNYSKSSIIIINGPLETFILEVTYD